MRKNLACNGYDASFQDMFQKLDILLISCEILFFKNIFTYCGYCIIHKGKKSDVHEGTETRKNKNLPYSLPCIGM